MPVIPAPERLGQVDSCEFKTSPDHMVSSSLPVLQRESLSEKKGRKEKRKDRKEEEKDGGKGGERKGAKKEGRKDGGRKGEIRERGRGGWKKVCFLLETECLTLTLFLLLTSHPWRSRAGDRVTWLADVCLGHMSQG